MLLNELNVFQACLQKPLVLSKDLHELSANLEAVLTAAAEENQMYAEQAVDAHK